MNLSADSQTVLILLPVSPVLAAAFDVPTVAHCQACATKLAKPSTIEEHIEHVARASSEMGHIAYTFDSAHAMRRLQLSDVADTKAVVKAVRQLLRRHYNNAYVQ